MQIGWDVVRLAPDLDDVEVYVALDTKVARELGTSSFPTEMVQGHKMSLEVTVARKPLNRLPDTVYFRLGLVHANTNDEVRTHDNTQFALFRERRVKGESESLRLEEIAQPEQPHLAKTQFDSMKLRVTSGGKKHKEVMFQFLLTISFSPSQNPCLCLRSPPFSVRAKNNDTARAPGTAKRKRKGNNSMETDGAASTTGEDFFDISSSSPTEPTPSNSISLPPPLPVAWCMKPEPVDKEESQIQQLQARLADALSLVEQLQSENSQLQTQNDHLRKDGHNIHNRAVGYRNKAKTVTKTLYTLYGDLNHTAALQLLMSDHQNQRFVAEEADSGNLSDEEQITTSTTSLTETPSFPGPMEPTFGLGVRPGQHTHPRNSLTHPQSSQSSSLPPSQRSIPPLGLMTTAAASSSSSSSRSSSSGASADSVLLPISAADESSTSCNNESPPMMQPCNVDGDYEMFEDYPVSCGGNLLDLNINNGGLCQSSTPLRPASPSSFEFFGGAHRDSDLMTELLMQ